MDGNLLNQSNVLPASWKEEIKDKSFHLSEMRLWQMTRLYTNTSVLANISEAFTVTEINYPSVMVHPHSLAFVGSCCMPVQLQRSMQPPLLSMQIQHAPPHTHIHQSVTVISHQRWSTRRPPSSSSSSVSLWIMLPSRSLVFNSQQSI